MRDQSRDLGLVWHTDAVQIGGRPLIVHLLLFVVLSQTHL